MEPTTKKKLHRGTDYYVRIYQGKYEIAVEPMANDIYYETTVIVLEYRSIVKRDAPV